MGTGTHSDSFSDPELEALLRRSAPRPPDSFVDSLERRLLGRPQPRFARRPLLAGLAAATGLTAVLLAFALASSGPAGHRAPANAQDVCKATVRHTTSVPRIVGPATAPRIEYDRRAKSHSVTRCPRPAGR